MKMCVCGNAVVSGNELCPACKKAEPSKSTLMPVVFWSVLTFVVTVAIGIALQGR